TYLGGSSSELGQGIAVDSSGSAYVMGFTSSVDFPTEAPYQPANHGNGDLFIAKVSPDGGRLLYSTYLGGSDQDTPHPGGIAVDGAGNACVTGTTVSIDYPTFNALLPNKPGGAPGSSAFVTKLNGTGSGFIFSTYLGGSGGRVEGYGIAADAAG